MQTTLTKAKHVLLRASSVDVVKHELSRVLSFIPTSSFCKEHFEFYKVYYKSFASFVATRIITNWYNLLTKDEVVLLIIPFFKNAFPIQVQCKSYQVDQN